MSNYLLAIVIVLFLIISLLMVLIVLIQKPQGGGLSGAFGGAGAGSSQTAFGARTGDVLTLVTIGIFLAFLGTAVGLNYMIRPPAPRAEPAFVPPDAAPPTTSGEAPEPTPIQPLPEQAPEPQLETQTETLPETQPEAQPETPPAEEGEGEQGGGDQR